MGGIRGVVVIARTVGTLVKDHCAQNTDLVIIPVLEGLDIVVVRRVGVLQDFKLGVIARQPSQHVHHIVFNKSQFQAGTRAVAEDLSNHPLRLLISRGDHGGEAAGALLPVKT